jgi:hypothetical protein
MSAVSTVLRKLAWLCEQSNAVENVAHTPGRQRANLVAQLGFVHGENLRDIDHALPEKIRLSRFEEYIAWRCGTSQIGGQRTHYHCVDTTTVEDVILDHTMWMTIAGLRAGGFIQFNSKDVTLLNYHSPSTICRCCRRMRRRRACSSGVVVSA